MCKLAIILTGTVEPAVKGGAFASSERFEMYTSTLDFYAQKIGKKYPIVFLENSNADLTLWNERFKDVLDLTIMQFRPDSRDSYGFDNSKGKGYNEYLMVKKGLERIAGTTPLSYAYILKITGRYPMLNVCTILNEIECTLAKSEIVFMGDIKDTCVYKFIGRDTLSSHWGDSRFFMAKIDYYSKYMINCYAEMNDYEPESWAEHYFLRLSRKFRHDPRFRFRYRTQVRFGGVSGASLNASYDSMANRVKASVRQIGRVLFPHIWF